MTEFDIQDKLIDKFLELDNFAVANGKTGLPYFVWEDNEPQNVHKPNEEFEVPDSKQWFDLTFRSNEPVDSSLGEDSQSRITGVLYIDIYTQQDVGESEASEKYRWIAKLFNDANIDYVDIMQVYISTKGNDADSYRLQVAIDWEADIDKE